MSKKETITIIDADSIIYMVAYNHSIHKTISRNTLKKLHRNIDSFVNGILKATDAKYYLGYYADPKSTVVPEKYSVATSHEYKGNRPKEKDAWYELFREPIATHLKEYWGFKDISYYEADDYVAQAASKFRDEGEYRVVISAIDKDLLQVHGVYHHNYQKKVGKIEDPTSEKGANYILYKLMIEGDTADNYKGVPGLGSKAVEILLKDCETTEDFQKVTKEVFKKYFNGELLEKRLKKTLNEQGKLWKINNPGQRLTQSIKKELKEEIAEHISFIKDIEDPKLWESKYKEMYDLAKLPDVGDYKKDMTIDSPVLNKFYLEGSKPSLINQPASITEMLKSIT